MKVFRFGLALSCLALLPLSAEAQNNTAATAARIAPNVNLFTVTDDGTNTERWYRFGTLPNRSYCVETSQSEFVSANPGSTNDSVLAVFSDGAGTVAVGTNDDNPNEPTHQGGGAAFGPSRFCDIVAPPGTGTHQVRLTDLAAGTQQWVLKIHDTTIFVPWFFQGGGFEAFVLIKNTTNTAITARVVLVDPTGAILGTQTGTAPGNGSFNLQVSAAPPTGFGLPSAFGGVIIAHNGSPGALVTGATSISFGTGTSFDMAGAPRMSWSY